MEDEKITLRMGLSDVQIMDRYLEEHPELGKRSLFIRTAIMDYIKRDAKCGLSEKNDLKNEGGIFIRLKQRELDTLGRIVDDSPYDSAEDFIKSMLRDLYDPVKNGPYADHFVMSRDAEP
ncbi:MAG: hypothetical protein LBV13_04615 [Methanomassiliicoccaceae archaeon]|nr:hypothetical protein [Methanomassiliicoccaceae archaeon]